MEVTEQTAERMLGKLRTFAGGLEVEERALLGALVAPAMARAFAPEVEGFAAVETGLGPLPDVLVEVLRTHQAAMADLAGGAVDDGDQPG